MRSFFINHRDGNISVYEYIGKELSVYKNKGEAEQTYDYDIFWNWWRDKVDYQDEEVSFLIATDQNIFDIPNDIQIAKQNILTNKIVRNNIDINLSGLNSINYPTVKTLFSKDSVNHILKFTKEYINMDTLTKYSSVPKRIKNIFLSSILFIFEKFISPLMQIPRIVWNKIEKEKERRADKRERLKIKSETRL